MAQTGHAQAVATSPLGAVTVEVRGSANLEVRVLPAAVPELPEGMIVDGVLLFAVRLGSAVERDAPIQLTATADQSGDPETGQFLDSVVFESTGGFLQVAIRDDEWLAGIGVVAEPVQYERRGLTQLITKAQAGTVLYASVAWRTAAQGLTNDSSTWFAADLALP
jgi:hypothetical protein